MLAAVPPESRRILLIVAAVLVAVILLWLLFRRARRRWNEGRAAMDELRTQSRAMNLQQQGMVDSVSEATQRRPPTR